jgi:hypothetical protein
LEDIDHGDALVIEEVLDDLSDQLDVTAALAGDLLDVSHPVDVRHHLSGTEIKLLVSQPRQTKTIGPMAQPASQSRTCCMVRSHSFVIKESMSFILTGTWCVRVRVRQKNK